MFGWLFTLLGWITDWRVIAVACVVLAIVAYRFLGPKISGAILALGTAFVMWRMGYQKGTRGERKNQERREVQAVDTRRTVQRSVSTASPDEVRKRLGRWVS
jgi:hypothetical protein